MIFVTYGPLVMVGVYYVLTRQLSLTPVWASLPIAFLVTLIAYLKSARFDVQDSASGKVILNVNVTTIRWLAGLAYLSLVALVIVRIIAGLVVNRTDHHAFRLPDHQEDHRTTAGG